MSKKMLIDATHPEETRVVVLENGRVEELDVDTSTKNQIKGNIYLAKIVRVEPSLQAAFVDYGGNRHGFLAFGEIHPDYYQIPVADREALKEMMNENTEESEKEELTDTTEKKSDVEVLDDSESEETPRQHMSFYRRYKIQEVIRQGQVMLVQVVKEERGNKGAALTTYLSLAGRFSVLMPNNGKGGGVSRKITNVKDRKSLRTIVEKLPIPQGMSVIIRTAGQGKTKTEIKRDYDYLIKTWMKIRDLTLESLAPKLIHEEGDIIKRSLRDVFTPDIEEIWVEGESIFKSTKEFMKILMPSQAKKIKQYKGIEPLFMANQVENQLEAIHSNIVQLKSGGYLVIDQTEALVAVDVNSGRATREHDIEETALRTNIETCEELARQLRLRDLAGLIVIDFIDMDEPKNNATIERKLKESLKRDRARIQVGKMSGFGLMEMSRQRLHSSLLESNYKVCPHCGGKGMTRSVESCAMHALHVLEEACVRNQESIIILSLPLEVATYILNNKRPNLVDLEKRYNSMVQVFPDDTLEKTSDYRLERVRANGERVPMTLQNPPRITNNKPLEKEKKQNEQSNKQKPENKPEKTKKSQQEVVAEVIVEGPDSEEAEISADIEERAMNSRRSRNNRRRNEWRKKRREKRLLARLAQAEEFPADAEDEEHFTVVEQQALSDYNAEEQQPIQSEQSDKETSVNTSEKQTEATVEQSVAESEEQTNKPIKDKTKNGKKKRPFKNRRSVQKHHMQGSASEQTADIVPSQTDVDISVDKVPIVEKTTEQLSAMSKNNTVPDTESAKEQTSKKKQPRGRKPVNRQANSTKSNTVKRTEGPKSAQKVDDTTVAQPKTDMTSPKQEAKQPNKSESKPDVVQSIVAVVEKPAEKTVTEPKKAKRGWWNKLVSSEE